MRVLLFETRSGAPLCDLPVSGFSCDTGILASDRIEFAIPASSAFTRESDLRGLLVPLKHAVALIDESVEGQRIVAAAGPIVSVKANESGGSGLWSVVAVGPERLLEVRHVRMFPGWPLVDAAGLPSGAFDVSLSGLEYGTIMKRLVAESEKWAGGDLPLVYEPDRVGTRVRNYAAIDGKPVLEALDELADLEGGVEYDFRPVIDDLDRVSWEFRTGTDADLSLIGSDSLVWNLGGARQDVRGYERSVSPADVATEAVFSGGKDDDRVLFARAVESALVEDGWPRVEVWDSSHSSVSEVATLQGWAARRISGPLETVSLDVRAEAAFGLRHGDLVQLAAAGHWDLPDGEYSVRVLSVARSSDSPGWVSVQFV